MEACHLNDVPVGFPPALGRDDTVGEIHGLEVRPAAFRDCKGNAEGMLDDGAMDLDGMSETA